MISTAVSTVSIIFDLVVVGLFIRCFFHARKEQDLIYLFSGSFFGLFLEIGTIIQTSRYQYGNFALMVFGVPISIGLAWGIIFYSSHTFVLKHIILEEEKNKIVKGILTGLLGLSVDLGMDAIAIRVGFWDWGNGLKYEFFGVPWGNFLAWFTILSSFSILHQIFLRKKASFRFFVPILGSLSIVFLTNRLMLVLKEVAPILLWIFITIVFGFAFFILFNTRFWIVEKEGFVIEGFSLISLHMFFFFCGIAFRIFIELPILLILHGIILVAYHILFGQKQFPDLIRREGRSVPSKV